ncbi:MAG: prefoldin subunit alpha [Methanomicrobiaceae archaeon]|nr:prefoldin subunit alpha [Methanomicrobiaceae archaeon]
MVNNVETVQGREMEMLQEYLNEFGQQIEILSRQMQMIEQRRFESFAAIDTLKELGENGSDVVLLQLGGGASLRVKVTDPDRVLLNIGSDVVVERSNAEAIDFLQDRTTEMEAMIKKLSANINEIRNQANEVAQRIEMTYRKARSSQKGQ